MPPRKPGRQSCTVSGPVSEIDRLTVRPPSLAEVLDDLAGLSMAHYDQFIFEVAPLPFDDHRREFPGEVLTERLIREAVPTELQAPNQSVRIIDRTIAADNRVER